MELMHIHRFFLLGLFVGTCMSDCVPPSAPQDAVIITPSQSEYPPWSRVSFSCPEEASPSGPSYSYCIDENVWSPRPDEFRCMARCKAPEVSTGVIHFPFGLDPEATLEFYDDETVIQYACAEDNSATLVGPNEATCMNGVWEPANIPTCNRCAPPSVSNPGIVQLSPSQESYAAYGQVRLSCPDDVMYTAKGTDITYCQPSGEWIPDPTKMTCHRNCEIPVRDPLVQSFPVGGTPETPKNIYRFNDVVQNQCIMGKKLIGPSMQRCVNGAWQPEKEIFCV